MLRQVVVEEQPSDIGGIHQVLAHGQPGRRIQLAALGPEGERQFREGGSGQVRLRIRKRRRFQVLGFGDKSPRARTCHFISSLLCENQYKLQPQEESGMMHANHQVSIRLSDGHQQPIDMSRRNTCEASSSRFPTRSFHHCSDGPPQDDPRGSSSVTVKVS